MKAVPSERLSLPRCDDHQMLRRERLSVLAILGIILLLQLELVFNRPVNWDESFHLSLVHSLTQGRPIDILQTVHVRLMAWLPGLGLGEIAQIRVTRLFMFGCELISLAAIYGLARRFAENRIALLAPLLYLAAGNVFQHGFSYRPDPLVTALLMSALWLLAVSALRLAHLAMFAVLVGLACLVTIKTVLLAPAFAGIAWMRLSESADPRRLALRIFFSLLGGAMLFIGGAALFQAVTPVGELSAAKTTIKASSEILFAEGLFPRWHYIILAAGTAPVFFAVLGATILLPKAQRLAQPQRIALIGLVLPLACLVFYRNAFPYFYAFILAPVAVGILPGLISLSARYSPRAIAICSLLGALVLSAVTPRAVQDDQQRVIAAVHRLFPQPVAYFDFAGMISAFPKANVFMTTWGQRRYRSGELESYAAAMQRLDVPLLLANNDVLMRNQSAQGPAWQLLDGDAAALREGYVQHWGPIWVAGKSFAAGSKDSAFMVHAGGTYTLEGSAARIDGRLVQPGEALELSKGRHNFASAGSGAATLRWGNHLPRIAEPAPERLPYKDF